jgi:hypothetical protein
VASPPVLYQPRKFDAEKQLCAAVAPTTSDFINQNCNLIAWLAMRGGEGSRAVGRRWGNNKFRACAGRQNIFIRFSTLREAREEEETKISAQSDKRRTKDNKWKLISRRRTIQQAALAAARLKGSRRHGQRQVARAGTIALEFAHQRQTSRDFSPAQIPATDLPPRIKCNK